ncbi:MAG: mechanosensitive ion channel [Bdellovibrionales bacterium]|nr:mechanosensitive ion channel [Bdellovibrionales bacterium]
MEDTLNLVEQKSNFIQEKVITYALEYGPKLLLAIVFLIVGMILIGLLIKGIKKAFKKADVDPSLQTFLVSLCGWSLKALLLISVASMLGIKTASFVAILGAAGLAVGLALQGSLANFAGGVLILLFKPFKVGDFINGQGISGTVREIHVFHTTLITSDGKKAVIPNGDLSNGIIENFTSEPIRRCEFAFGIGYGSDLKKAKEEIQKIIDEDARALRDPASLVAVSGHGASSVDLKVQVWCKTEDYWPIMNSYPEKVKLAFDAAGIEIPFPQMDVLVKAGSKIISGS